MSEELVNANPVEEPLLEKGRLVQGLASNTLVAGKTTALKLYCSIPTATWSQRIIINISGPRNYQKEVEWIREDTTWDPFYRKFQLYYEQLITQPYLVGRIKGSDLPYVGAYLINAKIYGPGGELETITLNQEFLPTKDVCVMLSRVWGQPLTWEEINSAHRAMARLGALYPVRDGFSYLDGHPRMAGLRYNTDFDPYPSDANLSALYDKYLQGSHTDPIHAGIAFRFPEAGEGSGGNAPHWLPNGIPFSLIVWRDPMAYVFCQETAHIFGLEPPESPNYDGGMHSKEIYINESDFRYGFDIQYNSPFRGPVYDVMHGIDYYHAPDSHVSLSSWDWEYLRERLMTINSTGPT